MHSGRVLRTEERAGIWQAQTPQMFRFGILRAAFGLPGALATTDEAQAVEALAATGACARPRLVTGSAQNVKVTYPSDLALAGGDPRDAGSSAMTIRIGNGFDVHALVAGRRLVLGGVTIPYELGLDGHSDADALLHAIIDAILGALALGDIGAHFPDSDARWKDADSRVLLRRVADLATAQGFAVENLDTTVIAQAPKLAPHVPQMRANIAADLGCDVKQVSVKATTTERLGFAGRERRDRRACDRAAVRALRDFVLRRQWNGDARDRATAIPPQEIERAAVQTRDPIDDRQPETGARNPARVRARRRCPREWLLQPFDVAPARSRARDRRPPARIFRWRSS